MRKLVTVFLFLLQVSLYSQTITNKKGEVFDIRNLESGSIVEYKFTQQGMFVHRNIYVDGEPVLYFKSHKKVKVMINGKPQKTSKFMNTIMLKFFLQQGFTSFSSKEGQKMIPAGNKVYVRNTNSQIWIKN